jgi:hypothetical protein
LAVTVDERLAQAFVELADPLTELSRDVIRGTARITDNR